MDESYLKLSDFNAEIYRISPDLRSHSKEELQSHFLQHGVIEGRVYNSIVDRKSFLNSINKKGKVLEIGPLDNPQMDHRSSSYYSIDVFDKATLIENYKHDPNVDPAKIIEPNYVIENNDYSRIQERFNCIFSSHNIEHVPCVVTFLNNLERLLTRDGALYLIVPDKRYCFDYYKTETSVYDVLQMYHENHTRPRLSDVLEMRTQSTHNDPSLHWNTTDHGHDGAEENLIRDYRHIVEEYNTGKYIDAHVSHFTPQSFLKIVNILKHLDLVNLRIDKMYHTLHNSFEFYVVLRKNDMNR